MESLSKSLNIPFRPFTTWRQLTVTINIIAAEMDATQEERVTAEWNRRYDEERNSAEAQIDEQCDIVPKGTRMDMELLFILQCVRGGETLKVFSPKENVDFLGRDQDVLRVMRLPICIVAHASRDMSY